MPIFTNGKFFVGNLVYKVSKQISVICLYLDVHLLKQPLIPPEEIVNLCIRYIQRKEANLTSKLFL